MHFVGISQVYYMTHTVYVPSVTFINKNVLFFNGNILQ
jgi:hypothetical protein